MSDVFFRNELELLAEQGLQRDLCVAPQATAGETVLDFSSNDYLGLARDTRLKVAAKRAIDEYGVGATASRLLAGNTELHEQLEADLACMMGTEAALVFGSGFLTNLGVLSSIAGPDDEVFSDNLNHASIIDGIRLSRAHCSRYAHCDLDHLESLLKKCKTKGKRTIVSESVFSMDGDIAPVKGLAELAGRYGVLFVIDEAHAVGIMGVKGGGVCRSALHRRAVLSEAEGTGGVGEVHPDIVVGTLSKALGGYGGFVACSKTVRRFLVNKARTFLFSTGLPPACLGAAREAVSIVTQNPGMGLELLTKAASFRQLLVRAGLNVLPIESQIIPIIIGDNEDAVRFSQLLMQKGLLIKAIRPPTVPKGTARVRLSMTLSMPDEALEKAAETIAAVAGEVGMTRARENRK